jgi:hypothetical protein
MRWALRLAGAVDIQRVSREDADADESEDCGELNHCSASLPIVAGNLPRDWFQIKLKMNCMVASLFC